VDRHRIGLIIPALNEAATIASVTANAGAYGIPIVVDDGSTDNTAAIATNAGAILVRHEVNRGYDGALNSGFARASQLGFEFVITMDADGQHDPALLGTFIKALGNGADVVTGIRDRRQRFAEHLFAWIGRAKWGIRDPLCGMKAYRMAVYNELGHFDSYNSIGTELAIYAAKRGKNIVQLPVKTRDRTDAPRFGRRFSANKRILRALWFSLLASPDRRISIPA
jgi:glycosyltransferase involved in cell wall biosynthesis